MASNHVYIYLLSECRNPFEKKKLFNEFEKENGIIPNANTMGKTNNNVVLFTLSKNRIKIKKQNNITTQTKCNSSVKQWLKINCMKVNNNPIIMKIV